LAMSEKQFLVQPWSACTLDGKHYLLKFVCTRDEGYMLAVTDYIIMHIESADKTEVEKRKQDLNPDLELPNRVLLDHLQSTVCSNMETAAVQRCAGDAQLIIKLTSSLSDLPLKWTFICTLAGSQQLSEHLTRPLALLAVEQEARCKELLEVIRRKDDEIKEYRATGARLSRKKLETQLFDETSFLENIKDKMDMDARLFTSSETKKLYQIVMERKIKDQEEKIVSSVKPAIDNVSSVVAADSTSSQVAQQVPSPKDEELRRRKELDEKITAQQKKKVKKQMKF